MVNRRSKKGVQNAGRWFNNRYSKVIRRRDSGQKAIVFKTEQVSGLQSIIPGQKYKW
jgi:hypothetical protein